MRYASTARAATARIETTRHDSTPHAQSNELGQQATQRINQPGRGVMEHNASLRAVMARWRCSALLGINPIRYKIVRDPD